MLKVPKDKVPLPQKQKKSGKSKKEMKLDSAQLAAEKKKKAGKRVEKALIHLRPKNLIEQKDLFFQNNCKVNPVFEYENPQLTQKTMQSYNQVSDAHIDIAVAILDDFLLKFGSQSKYNTTEGDILTQDETEQIMNKYIEDLGF